MAQFRSFGGWTRPQQYASAPRMSHISAPGAVSAPYAPAPGGGGDGAGVMPGYPSHPNSPFSPRFQQSVDRDRAVQQNRAADFAGGAPAGFTAPGLPQTDSASAYGSVEQSRAARFAFANEQRNKANIDSGNFFHSTQLSNDANTRANNESGAAVRSVDAQTAQAPLQGRLAMDKAVQDQLAREAWIREHDANTREKNARTDITIPGDAANKKKLTDEQIAASQGKTRETDQTRPARVGVLNSKATQQDKLGDAATQKVQNDATASGLRQQVQIGRLINKIAAHPTLDDATKREILDVLQGGGAKQGGAAPATGGAAGGAAGAGSPAPGPQSTGPSQADLEHTARLHGITVDEVLNRLRNA